MDEYWKRSGQIPAFGDWERANELPITQYFESARQAGLIRYSSSSGECEQYIRGGDLYAVGHHFRKPSRFAHPPPPRKTAGGGVRQHKKSGPHVKEQTTRQVKVICDVTHPPRKHKQQLLHCNPPISVYNCDNEKHTVVTVPPPPKLPPVVTVRPAKPVDEDLYKIPPELLQSSKRKKMPGLFSCLVPACAS